MEIAQCNNARGRSGFNIVDLTCHGQWNILPVLCQKPYSTGFANLANRTGASVQVVLARCHYCSSKMCLSFCANGPRSLQQMWLCKNHNSGTATSQHSLEWSWIEIVQCTKVKLRSCRWLPVFPSGFSFVLGKILLFWLLIWHFMASGIFFQFDARNHTVLVLPALPIARVHLFRLYWQDVITVLPRCACHFVQMGPDLFSKCGCARITTLGLLPVSILWNGPE